MFVPTHDFRAIVVRNHITRSIKLSFGVREGGVTLTIKEFGNGRAYSPVVYSTPAQELVEDENIATLELSEGTFKSLMEELQREFGAYAGVDYQRLRADYDRLARNNEALQNELAEANRFIRDALDGFLNRVRPSTRLPAKRGQEEGGNS